jgi:hypothetical protein
VGIGRPPVRRPVTVLDASGPDGTRQLQGPRASVVPVATDVPVSSTP